MDVLLASWLQALITHRVYLWPTNCTVVHPHRTPKQTRIGLCRRRLHVVFHTGCSICRSSYPSVPVCCLHHGECVQCVERWLRGGGFPRQRNDNFLGDIARCDLRLLATILGLAYRVAALDVVLVRTGLPQHRHL